MGIELRVPLVFREIFGVTYCWHCLCKHAVIFLKIELSEVLSSLGRASSFWMVSLFEETKVCLVLILAILGFRIGCLM